MFQKLVSCSCGSSYAQYAPTVIRIMTGIIFLVHGIQKLQGGVAGVAGFLQSLGFPIASVFAMILIATEILGGLSFVLGYKTHWSAKFLAVVAVVAFLTVHISKGFFMQNGGYEFILLILAGVVSVYLSGPGKLALDTMARTKQA